MLSSFSLNVDAAEQRWNLGTLTKTGKDNGYTGEKPIDIDDPHYGWQIGQFYVEGFTQRTTDSQGGDVFLKNVGDQVALRFEMFQDIDALNGNQNLSIAEDNNGYDQYFGTEKYNDCRGLLIIRKIDYQNATAEPVVYTNYLLGVSRGADTVVELCEEGDYEVALDYEIKEEHYGVGWNTLVSVPTYTNYRIFFKFKIRNGNCMVFPFDTSTGSELTNESFTPNGFYLDLANSRYLDIHVKRSVYVEGTDGYTEDVRFNRPAEDGTRYTDEGIYSITVRNNYTNQETLKTIYVGTDPVMIAYAVSGYSLAEIKQMLEEGYQISDYGELIPPVIEEPIVDEEEQIPDEPANIPVEEDNHSDLNVEQPVAPRKKNHAGIWFFVILLHVAIGAGTYLWYKKKKAYKEKNDTSNGDISPEVHNSSQNSESSKDGE